MRNLVVVTSLNIALLTTSRAITQSFMDVSGWFQ